ncbi:MAG: exodeoxyribonuclease I SbcB [Idiomarinaceae bacterium HL-53]|nr:MAG: exodeoxyribonuclease I SbcB [Idiomarinaceae bacterium HL-53]CUS48913.1 Exodeoxyribonuclease I subunit C [Idiomarinaceae bacterium HL-53]
MSEITFYWHDYEAGGVNPRVDRPMQFAGIRTNAALDTVGEPLNIFCQLPADYLPHPEACLITGITPQQCQRDGYLETEFAGKIAYELAQPNTVAVGYNNLRYDDEMTRFLFYRNFIDPYAHTWANQNSRWDLLELVRACFALRPEGIIWPHHDDGRVSLKLEDLAKANALDNGQAHDALVDVYATIALAKLIKNKQPKLFDYTFNHRKKATLLPLVNESILNGKPLVHVSGFYGATDSYCKLVLPFAFHPTQPNTVLAWRLDKDPTPWLNSSIDTILEALYARDSSQNERPGLIKIALNQCPFLAPSPVLSTERASKLGIDLFACQRFATIVQSQPDFRQKLTDVFQSTPELTPAEDVDQALYNDFFNPQSQSHMQMIRNLPPEQLAAKDFEFSDLRFSTLLFRYRARNYPATLSMVEQQRWLTHCRERIQFGGNGYLSADEFMLALNNAAEREQDNPKNTRILKDLYIWIQNL